MNIYNKIRMKLCIQSMVQINVKVALSTKSTTHYDTLGVSPNATHNEIKSAYYKLTFKYHPDRNKTESAKLMFQNVSNAYHVIGNYQSRKRYDRTIAVKHGKENITYKTVYRQTNIVQESPTMHKIYDFDEWTRQHYTNAFENDMRKKKKKMMFDLRYKKDPVSNEILVQTMVAGICTLICFYCIYFKEDYDSTTNKKNK